MITVEKLREASRKLSEMTDEELSKLVEEHNKNEPHWTWADLEQLILSQG